MLRLRIALFIIFAALSSTWAQDPFNIYKNETSLGTGTVSTDFTYRDSDVFSVGPGLIENEEWCWALTVAPTACLNGTAEYTPIILENPISNYTWNIVITRKSDGAIRNLNLTIKVRPSHAVTFTTNGGSPIPSTQTVLDGDKATEPGVNPTRTGYDFNGWDFDFDTEIKDTVTIPAKWDAIVYDITYNLDGGSGPESGTYTIETAVTLPTPTKANYTFGGWYTNDVFSGTAVASILLGSTGDTTFYAKWEINKHNVSFDANDGILDPSTTTPQTIDHGQIVTMPPMPPSKIGYNFLHWFKDSDPTEAEYNFSTPITTPITLKAKWQIKTYSVTFVPNGGTPIPDPNPQTGIEHGQTVVQPTPFARAGYTFDGWLETSGDTLFNFATPLTSNITLNAQWTAKNHTINFNANCPSPLFDLCPGSLTLTPITIHYDEVIASLPEPTLTGYNFQGWFTAAPETEYTDGMRYPIDDDVTLYAKWQIKTYSVTFVPNSGTPVPVPNPQTGIEHGQTVAQPTPFARAGYTFDGWLETSGDTLFNFATPLTSNITLNAQWTAKNHTINFNANCPSPLFDLCPGSLTLTPITIHYDEVIASLHEPTLTGYNFQGWFTAAPETEYTNGMRYPIDDNVTLYAKWQIKTYSVTFVLNGGIPVPVPNPQTGIQHGQTATEPTPQPEKTGYTFDGWLETSGDTLFNFATPLTSNITLTANWIAKTYTIDFDANTNCPESLLFDGETCHSNPTQKTGVKYGIAIGSLDTPALTGYNFLGWFYNEKKYEAATLYDIDGNITLIAQWQIKTFTVSFNSNGGPSVAPQTVNYNSLATEPTITRSGYDFGGWSFDFINTPIIIDTTLTATWNIINYNIKYFDGTTEITSLSPSTYTIEDEITLQNATKSCVSFSEWHDHSETPITKISKGSTGDKTFYANWSKMTPKPEDLDFTLSSLTYNGTDRPIIVSLPNPNSCGLTEPTILYNGTSAPPKNAGSYTVQASFGESNNYQAAIITLGTLAIDKATIIVNEVSATASDKAYDATTTAQITDISLDTPLLGNDQISPSSYSITSANFDDANAGQAKTITVILTWNLPNYDTQSWPTGFTTTANITKATGYLVIQAPASYELSNPIKPVVLEKNSFIADSLINWEYRRANTDEYSATLPRRVGEWIVKAWFNETDNYTGAADSAEFFVERGNATTVVHNVVFGETFVHEPSMSNNQLNYFTANACNIKNTDIYVTVIEDDIVFASGSERPGPIDYPDGFPRYRISHSFGKPGQDTLIYTLLSNDGIYSEQDTIIIETPIPFENIAMQKWNNVLFINNNPLTNGGYEFAEFKWFKNRDAFSVSEAQFYSAGPRRTDTLNSNDIYKVTMYTTNGTRISTCEGNPLAPETQAKATRPYEKQVLGINGKTAKSGAKIYNLKGSRIQSPPAGIYIVGENE